MAGYIGTKASVVTPGAERKKVFDITGATTNLTGLDYTPNFVHVYHNGVRLVDGTDYTATNGTSITLTVAAQNGDEVVVISYATFKAADAYTKAESDDRYVNVAGDTMTGALTIGGDLTVDTDTLYVDSTNNRVGVGTGSPSRSLHISGGTNSMVIERTDATTSALLLVAESNNTAIYSRASNASTTARDLIFNMGSTERLRIDSSGNVGIGTSSPARKLEVGGEAYPAVRINNNDSVGGPAVYFARQGTDQGYIGLQGHFAGTSSNDLYLRANTGNNMLFFTNGNNERMRIDSSGIVFVGKTSFSVATDGVMIVPDGYIVATQTSGYSGLFNRTSTDGEILRLQKDGSTVGTIGNNGARIYIGSAATGLFFNNNAASIEPYNTSTASTRDAAIDLGSSDERFKDLYLSGGVYLGGTGGANYLHDYEEGTYTALLTTGAGSITLNSSYNTLAYTKIGRQVTITGRVRVSSISSPSGNVQINLPFTSSNQTEEAGRAYFHLALYDVDLPDTNNFSVFAECGELANVATFIYARDSVPWEILPASGFKSSSFFYFGGTYITDS